MKAESPETFLSLRGDDVVYSGKSKALTAVSASGVQINERTPPDDIVLG